MPLSPGLSTEEVIATLEAMRRQEVKIYRCKKDIYLSNSQLSNFLPLDNVPVDESCRSRMIEWCYQVVDFCKFSRETVAIAVNYLDRYTQCSSETRNDRSLFQLASMTCLYTAIKVHEPQAMEPEALSKLSRGVFSKQEVIDMESKILTALQWQMNPPTAHSFVQLFLEVMPESIIAHAERDAVVELSKFQTELAISDPLFLATNPSTIALAAFSNSLKFTSLSSTFIESLVNTVIQLAEINCDAVELLDIEDRLFIGLESSAATASIFRLSASKTCKQRAARGKNLCESPRSVSVTTIQA
jgi:Cyclin, N-terminal domain/Cyclin, C-terminal domain